MRYRKRLILILITLLVISFSTSSSYALFTNKITLMSEEDLSNFNITNGVTKLDLSGTENQWSMELPGNNINGDDFLVENVDDSPIVKYGPITIGANDTNLHSNLDMKLDFFLRGKKARIS